MEPFDPKYNFVTDLPDIDEEEDPITKVKIRNQSICYWFDIDGRERTVYRKAMEVSLVESGRFDMPDGYQLFFERRDGPRFTVMVADPSDGIVAKEKYEGTNGEAVKLVFALYCNAVMVSEHGGVTSYGGNVEPFLKWLVKETMAGGFLGWMHENKLYVPFPDEMWQIYRVHVMARYNLRELPSP